MTVKTLMLTIPNLLQEYSNLIRLNSINFSIFFNFFILLFFFLNFNIRKK